VNEPVLVSYGSFEISFILSGDMTFSQVVMEVMRQLEGAYALIFKSPHYPNELIACKRGSTLILGVNVGK
jgi:glucosamine--fructose-6-phosphate aminotransferase (isomerizing)